MLVSWFHSRSMPLFHRTKTAIPWFSSGWSCGLTHFGYNMRVMEEVPRLRTLSSISYYSSWSSDHIWSPAWWREENVLKIIVACRMTTIIALISYCNAMIHVERLFSSLIIDQYCQKSAVCIGVHDDYITEFSAGWDTFEDKWLKPVTE